ncbi:MAG TPA: hypothetical protein VGB67_14815, partial [Fibrella sp.]
PQFALADPLPEIGGAEVGVHKLPTILILFCCSVCCMTDAELGDVCAQPVLLINSQTNAHAIE